MEGKKEAMKGNTRGFPRKRYHVMTGKTDQFFNLHQPLNLSEAEYNRWKKEMEKRGNVG